MTENGFAVMNETDMLIDQAIDDTDRVEYFRGNCEALLAAITEDGVDVRSYFAWSEFGPGYSVWGRFSDRVSLQAYWTTLNGLLFISGCWLRGAYSTSQLPGPMDTRRGSVSRTWTTKPRNDIQKSPGGSFQG